jgi:hypothetical protein
MVLILVVLGFLVSFTAGWIFPYNRQDSHRGINIVLSAACFFSGMYIFNSGLTMLLG